MKLCLMICAAAASTALIAEDAFSAATYAVMNVPNANTDTVIAVPWVGLGGGDITISNLVNTTTLDEGDELYMYDNGTWYEYTKSSSGTWTGATTITMSGDHTAESQVVQRGTGLILHRSSANGNVFLCGRVDSGTISTTLAGATTVEGKTVEGKTLFANPTAEEVDITTKFAGATEGDTIMIPKSDGKSDKYTYNGTEWGKFEDVEDGTVIVAGQTFKRYTQQWQKGGKIPAGTGAWYTTTGKGYKVTW